MEIKVNSVNINYIEGEPKSVIIYFEGKTKNGDVSINGHQSLAHEDYIRNEDIENLKTIIKETLSH